MTSLLLFVDIETNGLNPITDEIIEIAGILCSWDGITAGIISTFDQTIANVQPIDPIVTKITGLTDQLLASSSKAFVVRDNWATWLEGQIEKQSQLIGDTVELVIVGHSLIEFDRRFLQAQSWYLPETSKFYDTFYLSKILLPQLSAVNLESLTVNLDLNPEVLMKSGSLPPDKIVPHRALYDTACCLDLWLKLLGFIRLYDLPADIKQALIEGFVGVKVYDLDTNINKHYPIETKIETNYQSINWSGTIVESGVAKQINNLNKQELEIAKLNLATIKIDPTSPKWQQIYLQLSIMLQARFQFGWTVHTHGQKSDHSYIQHIAQVLKNKNTSNKLKLFKHTPLLENLIWQVDELSSRTVNMHELVNLINICQEFDQKDSAETGLQLAITKLINSYDFWVISLNQFWVKSQYQYNPDSMPINQEAIFNKFQTLQENMEASCEQLDLYLNSFEQSEQLVSPRLLAYNWLKNWLASNKINYKYPASLVQVRDAIKISYRLNNFGLISSITELLSDNSVKIPTFLTTRQAQSLINLYELSPISSLILERLEYKYRAAKLPSNDPTPKIYPTQISWIDGYPSQIEELYENYRSDKTIGRPRLWLCATNSLLTKISTILESIAQDRHSYNIVGLTGSITKITSKIKAGFDGIAVIKQTDIYMLGNLPGTGWDSITIIGNYHSFVSPVFGYINLATNQNRKLELTQLLNSSLKNQIIVNLGS